MAFFFVCLEYMHKYICPNLFLSTFSSRMVQSEVFCFATTIFNKAWKPNIEHTNTHTHTHTRSQSPSDRCQRLWRTVWCVVVGRVLREGLDWCQWNAWPRRPAPPFGFDRTFSRKFPPPAATELQATDTVVRARACVRAMRVQSRLRFPYVTIFAYFKRMEKGGKQMVCCRSGTRKMQTICWAARSWDHFKGGLKYKRNKCMFLQK